jgi:hypothetical protein
MARKIAQNVLNTFSDLLDLYLVCEIQGILKGCFTEIILAFRKTLHISLKNQPPTEIGNDN